MEPRERFGRLFVEQVRDPAIVAVDDLVRREGERPDSAPWRDLLSTPGARAALAHLLPDVVDEVLFLILDLIDNDAIDVRILGEDGSVSGAEVGSGELGGWFMGSPGWRNEYSRKRFNDYLEGIELRRDWEA